MCIRERYIRTIAENTGSVPRYAWFKAPRPSAAYRFDGGRGYTGFSENRISCISKVDGKALHEEETAILLKPGQRIEIDFLIPHEPVSADTAEALPRENFSDRQVEGTAYLPVTYTHPAPPPDDLTEQPVGAIHIKKNTQSSTTAHT